MKNKILCIVVVLASCSSPKKESEIPPIMSELGWVAYEGGDWQDVGGPEQYVVQLGMRQREACSDGHLCFVAQPVTDLEATIHQRLCLDELGNLAEQYAVGRYTGVVVWPNKKKEEYVVVTAHHGKGYIPKVALASHDLGNSSRWLRDGMLEVPAEFVYRTRELRGSNKQDVLVLGLNLRGKNRGAVLAGKVEKGMKVDAFIHPFGLPMKMIEGVEVGNCDDVYCSIDVDMAVGGSGGPVFTQEGQLAGILVGTDMHATSNTDHQHDTNWLHPCDCTNGRSGCSNRPDSTVRECETGQRFVRVEVISEILGIK